MLCGALLGKSPLFTALFANRPNHESFEAVFNPVSKEQTRLLPVHRFYLGKNFQNGLRLEAQTVRIGFGIWMCPVAAISRRRRAFRCACG
jgi:hypothetical protein